MTWRRFSAYVSLLAGCIMLGAWGGGLLGGAVFLVVVGGLELAANPAEPADDKDSEIDVGVIPRG